MGSVKNTVGNILGKTGASSVVGGLLGGIPGALLGGLTSSAYQNKGGGIQGGGPDPFFQQLADAGFVQQGLIPYQQYTQGNTLVGNVLAKQLQPTLAAQAASSVIGSNAANALAPQQIQAQAELSAKDYEALKSSPMYGQFIKNQELLQQSAAAGLEPGADKAQLTDISNILGQTAASFGLEGSPFAAQGYAQALGGAAQGIRSQRINDALNVQNNFRMPGSFLGGLQGLGQIGFSDAFNLLQSQTSQKFLENQNDLGIKQGYGQLLGSVGALGAAFCWVAEELYGIDHPKTHAARRYCATHDNAFTRLYRKEGRSWASFLAANAWAKPLVKPIWDAMAVIGANEACLA